MMGVLFLLSIGYTMFAAYLICADVEKLRQRVKELEEQRPSGRIG
jgi:hypothetical protein